MTGMTEDDRRIHPSPYSDWHATQDGSRGVWLCEKASERKVKVEPPAEWGRHWSWNVTRTAGGSISEDNAWNSADQGTGLESTSRREP